MTHLSSQDMKEARDNSSHYLASEGRGLDQTRPNLPFHEKMEGSLRIVEKLSELDLLSPSSEATLQAMRDTHPRPRRSSSLSTMGLATSSAFSPLAPLSKLPPLPALPPLSTGSLLSSFVIVSCVLVSGKANHCYVLSAPFRRAPAGDCNPSHR